MLQLGTIETSSGVSLIYYLKNRNISFVLKFNTKKFATNSCSQISVLNLTLQDGVDAESMLLLLLAEDWHNNNRGAQYSKCKLSIYLTCCLQKW
jgi:hypothetical protein